MIGNIRDHTSGVKHSPMIFQEEIMSLSVVFLAHLV